MSDHKSFFLFSLYFVVNNVRCATSWLRLLVCVFQNKAEADRGGLRVPKEMLWNVDGREQEAKEGAAGAEGTETGAAFVHAYACGHPHHVPLLWEA